MGVKEDMEQPKAAKAQKDYAPPRAPFHWSPFSLWKRMFFFDIDPLVTFGYKHRLEPQDTYEEPSVKSTLLNEHFEPAWERQLKRGDKASLKMAIWAGNVPTLIFTAFLYGISQACSLAGPLLLQRIVAGIGCQPYAGRPGVSCEPKEKLY
jgi:ATP-binding cassette subfamily C (CFTR/MRP) protein 1